jgi:hypothetical protein
MAHSTPARSTSLGCEVLSHGTSHELTRSDQECGSLVWHATIQWVRNGPSRATYIAAHTAGYAWGVQLISAVGGARYALSGEASHT